MSELVSSFAVGTHQLQKRVQLQMRYAMVGKYSIPHACCFFFHIMWPFCEANPPTLIFAPFPDDELTSNKEMSLLLTNTALQMVVLKI
ncbi:hypothetical protein T4B_1308 [Trichinella pseudospiralis]|uniref:Uncharacterized protein n=1 Tax=Trichinella pseudospiralis TaxID=6337 RepID=A0A0V1IM71_TRIPS|nr:hypothetical protein T4B_1308 [Trichinella pseudospiralis]